MALVIDIARALRSHHSRVELVEAIVAAPAGTQETQAIEWKSQVDLADRLWRFRLAKGVLGFANRDPSVAARWFEGCAYLVAGASPGQLAGTEAIDAAKLEDMLAPYLGKGPAGPDWSPDYIEVDGKHVLVITVEPPRAGNPIWTLLKEYAPATGEPPTQAGTVMARHKASTDTASPADIAMLTRRATTTGSSLVGLSLVLSAESSAAPIDTGDGAFRVWFDAEAATLKLPPEPPKREPNVINRVDLNPDPTKTLGLKMADLLRAAEKAGAFPLPPTDSRTREEYELEVSTYLAKSAERLPGVVQRSAIRRGWGKVVLDLRNDTPNNFHEVEVELYIATPGAQAYFESFHVPGRRLSSRPTPYGKEHHGMFDYISSLSLPSSYVPSFLPSVGINRGEIDNSASARIRFPHVDVRPKRLAELDVFYLVVPPDLAGTTITASWSATATDASGDMAGNIEIPVMGHVPTTGELLADAENDDGRYDSEDD